MHGDKLFMNISVGFSSFSHTPMSLPQCARNDISEMVVTLEPDEVLHDEIRKSVAIAIIRFICM